jgi:putative transcriptional regulator
LPFAVAHPDLGKPRLQPWHEGEPKKNHIAMGGSIPVHGDPRQCKHLPHRSKIATDIQNRPGFRYSVTKKLKYRSDVSEAIHSSVAAMYSIETIDKATMREFDKSCLVPDPFKPREIRKIRQSQKVSQPVFARYLNTSESTVEKWETGVKKTSGMALKLLSIVQKYGLQILD